MSPPTKDENTDTTRRSLVANERLTNELSALEVMAVAAQSVHRADTVGSRFSPSVKDPSLVSLSPLAETPKYLRPYGSAIRVEEFDEEPLEHILLDVPNRWNRIVSSFRSCWLPLKNSLAKQVPMTIPAWRQGIQWTVALALTTIPSYVRTMHDFFKGAEIFIAISAVTVFDPTIGGHVRKLLDRVGANIAAAAMAAVVFLPLSMAGYHSLEDNPWLTWVLYANAVLVAFAWGYIINLYPKHVTLPSVGICGSMTLYVMTTDDYVSSMWRVTLANLLGVFIGSIVFRFVLPRRARELIQNDLVQVFEKIAETLEPLVVLDAGLVHSASFFNRRPRRAGSLLRKLSRAASRRSVSRTPDLRSEKVNIEVDYASFQSFRDDIWGRVETIATLLNAQEPLLRPAEREYSRRKPHRFPSKEYKVMLDACKRLFYQIVSLYLVLDTHGVVASMEFPEAANDILGPQWEFTGTVRIKRPEGQAESVTNPESETIKRHFTQPTQGLARALRRPSSTLNDVKGRFASDPTLWTFDDMGSRPALPVTRNVDPQTVVRDVINSATPESSGVRFAPNSVVEKQTGDASPDMACPGREATLQLPVGVRGEDHEENQVFGRGENSGFYGLRGGSHLGELTPASIASPASPQTRGSVCEESALNRVLTDTGLDYHEIVNIPVMQWAQVYGPLVADVSRQVAGCTVELAVCLKTLSTTASVDRRMEIIQVAIDKLTKQREQWYKATENLLDAVMRGDSEHVTPEVMVKAETEGVLMETWLGMTSEQYLKLTKSDQESLWRSFGTAQDRMAQTARILNVMATQLSHCYEAMREFIVAMGGKVEKTAMTA